MPATVTGFCEPRLMSATPVPAASFQFQAVAELPALAWIAVLKRGASAARVYCGRHVETHDGFFIEGVWAGEFSEAKFDASDCVFGSGGHIAEGKVTFVTSTATMDFLYLYDAGAVMYVSNSLALVLSFANDQLDPRCLNYATINWSIAKGIKKYITEIPTRNNFVKRIVHRNVEYSGGALDVVDKPLPPRFESFAAYRDYLACRLAMCMQNARHRGRRKKLRIYSTQSKGYDCTAINAIARDFGVGEAFTVQTGKSNRATADRERGREPDDDGTDICSVLGIEAIPIDRRQIESDNSDELLYWAGMHRPSDFNMCGIAAHAEAPALLLTGHLGEIWYSKDATRPGTVNDELVLIGVVTEVRLKTGYVQLPAPFIGARRREDIFRITNSAEMSPWKLNVRYDRPIPRRIAEEAGVPRHMFGQHKTASVVELAQPSLPLNERLRDDFLEFLNSSGLLEKWSCRLFPVVHAYNAFAAYKGRSQNINAYYADRLVRTLTLGHRGLGPLWKHLDGSIYCFAVNRLAANSPRP